MTIDEASRLHLYEQARRALDDAAADTLMNALRDPDRVATREDISELKTELRSEIMRLDTRISVVEANLRGDMKAANSELLRTLFFGMIASNATLVGLVFAAVRLA